MDPRWICFWVGVSVTAVPCLVIGGWFMLFLLRVPDEEHDGYWLAEWGEIHDKSESGRHAVAMVMQGSSIIADCYKPEHGRLIVRALVAQEVGK